MAVLSIPDSQGAIFRKLSEIREDQFADLARGFGEVRASLSVETFCKGVYAFAASIPEEDVDDYVRLICGLYPLMENHEKSPQRIAADIAETLKQIRSLGFTPEIALLVGKRMEKLLSIGKAIAITAKARDVATEQHNVYCGVKIYSDIRPIFSASADSISAALVLHNLNISYHQSGEHKDIYFALENSELNELKLAIERAEKKAKQLQEIIKKSEIEYLE